MHYSDIRENLDDSSKFKSTLEASIPVFQKRPEARTEADHNQIFETLQKIPFFRRYFDYQLDKNVPLLQLSKVFQYEEYPKNTALYHHGSIPQKIFLILEGELANYVMKTEEDYHTIVDGPISFHLKKKHSEDNEPSTGREGRETSEIVDFKSFGMDKKYFKYDVLCFKLQKVYQAGNFMGDVNVVFNTPYEDTLVTWTHVKAVSIDKKEFKRIFEEILLETQEKCLFFREIFPKVDHDVLTCFGYAFDKKVLKSHDRVFQKGTSTAEVYIVTEGEIELFENFHIEEGKQQENGKMKSPKKSVKMSVLLVSRGQFFGEEALLEEKERIFTAVAKNLHTVVYSVPATSLVKLGAYYPEFIRYLTSQVKASYESKLKRLENLKRGMEKIAQSTAQAHQKSPGELRNSGIFHRDSPALSNYPMLGRQNTNENSPGLKSPEDRLSSSPRMFKISSRKMTEPKAGFLYDQIKMDNKSPTTIEELGKQSPKINQMNQMGNSMLDNQKKYYYPENLWEHEKKQHQEKLKKVRKDKIERNVTREIMESLNTDRTSRGVKTEYEEEDEEESYCFQNPQKLQHEQSQRSVKKNKEHTEEDNIEPTHIPKFKKRFHSNMGLGDVIKPERQYFATEASNSPPKRDTKRFLSGQLAGFFSPTAMEDSSPMRISRLDTESGMSSARQRLTMEPAQKITPPNPTTQRDKAVLKQKAKQGPASPGLKLSISGMDKAARLAKADLGKPNFFINISSSVMIQNDQSDIAKKGNGEAMKSPRREDLRLPIIPTKSMVSPKGMSIKGKHF